MQRGSRRVLALLPGVSRSNKSLLQVQTFGFKERYAELHLTHRGMRIYRGIAYDLGLRLDICNCFNCRNPHLLVHFVRAGISADAFKEAFHSACNAAGMGRG